jgi:hypothetical protein
MARASSVLAAYLGVVARCDAARIGRRSADKRGEEIMNANFFAICTLAIVGLASADASAGASDGLERWEGTGTVHAGSGAELAGYTVSLTRKPEGAGKVRTDGIATLANGQVIAFWQEIEHGAGGGFRIVSSNGSGGGRCFTNAMCQSYEERQDGHAFATTIVKDDAERMRILVTELDQGRAVRFMEQTLTKK